MKRWSTSVFLILALAGGVLAGTPLFTSSADRGMSAMECCKKKKMGARTPSAAQLCCAVNCSEPAPTAPGVSFNFTPSAVITSDPVIKQIALMFKRKSPVSRVFLPRERKVISQKFQPKYIQYHSFLI